MKLLKLHAIGILVLVISSGWFAMAHGGMEGGGAKGYVCRDSLGRIKSVELLDLWEARAVYGRIVQRSTAPVEKQVEAGIQNLKTIFYSIWNHGTHEDPRPGYLGTEYVLRYTANYFLDPVSNLKPVTEGKLVLTVDPKEALEPEEKNGCKLEQVVTYFDYYPSEVIFYDKEIYDHMDETNKAALILHESLYKILRDESRETNSLRTRRAVGLAMSGVKLPALRTWVEMRPRLECWSHRSEIDKLSLFYLVEAWPAVDGRTAAIAFVPEIINGVHILGQIIKGGYSHSNGVDFYSIQDLLKPSVNFSLLEPNQSLIDYDIFWEGRYRNSPNGPQVTLTKFLTRNGMPALSEPIVADCQLKN